jgi:hypothetical protein
MGNNMKIEDITKEKVIHAFHHGDSVDHGLGGEYDFGEVVASADINDLLMALAVSEHTEEELLHIAKRLRLRLGAAMFDVTAELVESWDE